MTFCKMLAQKKIGNSDIEAWELYDKNSMTPRYEITISVDGIALMVEKTAKTTWKKCFENTVNAWR